MARIKRLSNISYMPVVEHISRKFALRNETVSLKPYKSSGNVQRTSGYMGAGVRYKVVDGAKRLTNYIFMRKNPRTSSLTAKELAARANFIACQEWVKAAMEDLSVYTDNQIKYQECFKGGKTIKHISAKNYGFRGFMFAVAMEIRKSGGTLPEDHNLPAYDA